MLRVALALTGAGLLLAGLAAVLTGVLPVADVAALATRVVPVLGFVVAITVVAALAAEAGLFRWIAEGAARLARGRAVVLWLLVVAIAVASTIFLSLDTTAVLLTPIVVAVAQRAGLPAIPFAMTTVWLANTASLLLPVSNLTNLLAGSGPVLGRTPFAQLSAGPAVACVLVPVALLGVLHRGTLRRRYDLQPSGDRADRVLRTLAGVVVAVLIPLLASGVPVWIPAAAAAIVLVVAFAVRAPRVLRPRLLPLSLVLFVCGLFLVVAAAGRMGLTGVLGAVAGTGEGLPALLRLAGVATAAGNLADNLPAYLALEPVARSPVRLVVLLVAVNAGPLVTPWASLATLLWHGRLTAAGIRISWLRFAGLGLVAAPLTVAAGTAVAALTR